MRILVKLFAGLSRYREGTRSGHPFDFQISDRATVADLLVRLALPEKEINVVFVNGRARHRDWLLGAEDEVGIFPLVGGG